MASPSRSRYAAQAEPSILLELPVQIDFNRIRKPPPPEVCLIVALPQNDNRRPALLAVARRHRDEALPRVTGEHYEGGHWLGSFATYLVTQRGIPRDKP